MVRNTQGEKPNVPIYRCFGRFFYAYVAYKILKNLCYTTESKTKSAVQLLGFLEFIPDLLLIGNCKCKFEYKFNTLSFYI